MARMASLKAFEKVVLEQKSKNEKCKLWVYLYVGQKEHQMKNPKVGINGIFGKTKRKSKSPESGSQVWKNVRVQSSLLQSWESILNNI